MADPGDAAASRHHQNQQRQRRRGQGGLRPRAWCCSFAAAPQSPDAPRRPTAAAAGQLHSQASKNSGRHGQKPPGYAASFHSSPSPSSTRIGRGLIDPRRILSPGRVSPIDSDASAPASVGLVPLPEAADTATSAPHADALPDLAARDLVATSPAPVAPRRSSSASVGDVGRDRMLDLGLLRVALRGKDGRTAVLELDPELLCASSAFFARKVLEPAASGDAASSVRRRKKIEVANVEDVQVFRETLELVYERDAMTWLAEAGVSRAIAVLEVSSTIQFERGIVSCLKYLEAVPWSESEEEKLKNAFARCTIDDYLAREVLSRLFSEGPIQPENLALQLVQSVARGRNTTARKEMQSLVNGLLSKSSVYQKDPAGLNKDGLYSICKSCLSSLEELFHEASSTAPVDNSASSREDKPLRERVSKQVDNLNWLLEILIEKQIAEDFVDLWANQNALSKMHEMSSPLVRYELSRVSACVFMAIGRGRLQCRGELRHRVISSWFAPMLFDFGWLQRCSKGLDMRMLEDSLGQALLTLPLTQQQILFMQWFKCFSRQGTECPNLSRAFQIWWRRSFPRPKEIQI